MVDHSNQAQRCVVAFKLGLFFLIIPELCIAGIAAASRVPEASQAWVEGGVF